MAEDTARLVHELQVHQIELEMQNEELQQARAKAGAFLAQYTDLYDFAPTGYLSLDREGAIGLVNLNGARLLGFERSRLLKRRFGQFVAESDRRAFSDFLQRVFASEAKECCEVTLQREGLRPFVVQIEGTRSEDGQKCRAIVQDITRSRQSEEQARTAQAETHRLLALSEQSRRALLGAAEDEREAAEEIRKLNAHLEQRVRERTTELEAANQELEAFSYSVSHDLRAPLRAIDGFSRILVEEHASALSAEGRRVLTVVIKESQRMGRLVDDLLAFSRIGRQSLHPAELDLSALVGEIFREQVALAPSRKIELQLGALPRANADLALLRQVVVNLISNAIKYTRARDLARIEVGGSVRGSENVYFIKDNGAGFDPRYADKLFGVFQRLHSEGEFEGTGVGLALVQRIINRHGGRVWAEGQVDQGATFYFTLPTGRR